MWEVAQHFAGVCVELFAEQPQVVGATHGCVEKLTRFVHFPELDQVIRQSEGAYREGPFGPAEPVVEIGVAENEPLLAG